MGIAVENLAVLAAHIRYISRRSSTIPDDPLVPEPTLQVY